MLPAPPLDVVAIGPVSCGAVVWRSAGVLRVTVVVKAAFSLTPDQDASIAAPSPPASDMAPYLPTAGVVLVGHAHAPGGQPTTSVAARLALFGAAPLFDKTIHVFGDVERAGAMPAPFQRMPLVYERAYGGPSVPSNPVGTGLPGTRRPNLVDPTNAHRPAGFGPIAAHWPMRRRFFGAAEPSLGEGGVLEVSESSDFRAFNPAPLDQQVPFLAGDEWIVMDNLCAGRGRVQTRLPSVRAVARCYRAGAFGELPLVADTLALDADRLTCSLVWRGSFAIEHLDDLVGLRVYAGMEQPGVPVPWPDPGATEAGVADPLTTTGVRPTAPVLPFEERDHITMEVEDLPRAPPPPIDLTGEAPDDPNAQTGKIVISKLRMPVLPFQGRRDAEPPREETKVISPAALLQGLNAPFDLAAPGERAEGDAEIPGAPWSAARPAAPPSAPEEHTVVHALPRRDPVPDLVFAPVDPPRPAPNPAPPEPPADVPPVSMPVPSLIAQRPAFSPPASVTDERRKVEEKLAEGRAFDDDDLSGADLSGLDFRGRSLRRCTLRGAKLRGADLSQAILVAARMEDADLSGASLEEADLDRANLSRAVLADARLDRAKLSEAVLEKADLDRASLAGANLEGARISRAHGDAAILDRAVLKGADLRSSRFPGASFAGADLREAQCDQGDFTGARFVRADLSAASLRKAVLAGAVLAHAQLEGTDLRNADLERANVHGASRRTAKLTGANVKDLDESPRE